MLVAFSALTLLVWRQEGHPARKNIWGRWWRWALVSPDGVAPSQMVSVSASVNLPLHYKVQKFSSGTGSPRWSRKKGRKTVVWCGIYAMGQHWSISLSVTWRYCFKTDEYVINQSQIDEDDSLWISHTTGLSKIPMRSLQQ